MRFQMGTWRYVRLLVLGFSLAVSGCCSRPAQYVVTYSVWYTLNFDAPWDNDVYPDDGRRVHYEVNYYDPACDCQRTEFVYQSGWLKTVTLNPGDQATLYVDTNCIPNDSFELGNCWNWDTVRRMEILHDGEVMRAEEDRYDPDAGTPGSIAYLVSQTARAYWWAPEPCGVT